MTRKEELIARYVELALSDADANTAMDAMMHHARRFLNDAQLARIKKYAMREAEYGKQLMREHMMAEFAEDEIEVAVAWVSSDVNKKLVRAMPAMMELLSERLVRMSSTIETVIEHPEKIDEIIN